MRVGRAVRRIDVVKADRADSEVDDGLTAW
jgi:hypothetical protein